MRLFGSDRIAKVMDRMGIKDGEVIDLTSKQYSLHNIGVPSSGMAARLKEQGRRTGFATEKKNEEQTMAIIDEMKKK